jgi:3D (Asp-Asp-Asp) domain-containing protein
MEKFLTFVGVIVGIILGVAWGLRTVAIHDSFPAGTGPTVTVPTQTAEDDSCLSLPLRVERITSPKTIRMFITAYDACDEACVGKHAYVWPRKTATGSDAELPGVAADLAAIPAGSKVNIPGMGTFTVDDDGGAMRCAARKTVDPYYQLDVRVPAHCDRYADPRIPSEAHFRAAQKGANWIDVSVTPPGGP